MMFRTEQVHWKLGNEWGVENAGTCLPLFCSVNKMEAGEAMDHKIEEPRRHDGRCAKAFKQMDTPGGSKCL